MLDDNTAAPVLDAGADTGLDFDISTDVGTDAGVDTGADTGKVDAGQDGQQVQEQKPVQQQQQVQEEPDVRDFAGHASNRLRNLVKKSPELGKALTNPEIRNAIEAPLRREAAYRDIFPTVAEAKAMRETFPNGLQDVAALKEDLREIEEIDNLTYTRDAEGNYSGHGKLIDNIFSSDRNAAVALFRTLPREWHRLDPGSYNEVMGKIVGATLIGSGSWEQLVEMREQVASTDALKGLLPALDKVLVRLSPFVEERRPDPQSEALNRERQQFDRQRQQVDQQSQQQFARTFESESRKLQTEIISGHRVMQKLATVKSITPQKRAEITEKIRAKVEKFLAGSPAFMRKLIPAYQSRNMDEAAQLQRSAWSQQWLLDRMIRDVLKVETPQLLQANRATVGQRTSAAAAKKPEQQQNGARTAPFKEGGQWYHANGRHMTVQEAMRQELAST